MRVVGEVLGNSEQLISDAFIIYRLRKLMEDGRLEAIESGSSLRDFIVRVAAARVEKKPAN